MTDDNDTRQYPSLPEIRPSLRKDRWHGELLQTDYLTEQRRPGYAPEKRPCLLAVVGDGRYAYIRFARDGSEDTDAQVMRRLAATLIEQADLLEAK